MKNRNKRNHKTTNTCEHYMNVIELKPLLKMNSSEKRSMQRDIVNSNTLYLTLHNG